MSGMLDWAQNEVDIACKRENPNRKKGEFDYGCACYESALKAFKSLLEDGHSGYSIGFTKQILVRLINGQPLTPIEDTEDIWNFRRKKGDEKIYQCKRMSSLFKYVHDNGTVKYTDVDRVRCKDLYDSENVYSFGLVDRVINEMVPIAMPYMPSSESIKVTCVDFLVNKENSNFDTVGILNCINNSKVTEIHRFFKAENGNWIEIDEYEFYERFNKRINKRSINYGRK